MENDYLLSQWLKKIDHVTSNFLNGREVYFSHAPNQRHLAKLVGKQVNNSKNARNSRGKFKLRHEAPCYEDSRYATPNTWANSLIFRRSQLTYQTNQSLVDETMKHHTPQSDTFYHPPQPQAPKRPLPFAPVDKNETNKRFRTCFSGHEDELEPECDQINNNVSSGTNLNMSSLTDKFSESDDNVSNFILCLCPRKSSSLLFVD